jgi:hypothetical protein
VLLDLLVVIMAPCHRAEHRANAARDLVAAVSFAIHAGFEAEPWSMESIVAPV